MNLSEVAAEWSGKASFNLLPADVVEAVKLRILDTIGVILAARDTALVASVRASAAELYGEGDVRAIGFPHGTSAAGAALINGTAALALEFDDSHLESGIHPSCSVVSACLPTATRLGLSGQRLIEAVTVGNELTCRLGLVAPGAFHRHGFHPTGIFGTFGATYALAKCRSLDRDRTVNAVGISGSMAAASMASWEDGTAAKSLHAGLAAAAAEASVALAAHGVSGPAVIFDGRFGFFRAHVQDTGNMLPFDEFGQRLASSWEVRNIVPKAYPCGHYIQPFVEAGLILQRQHGFSAEQVVSIRCSVADYTIPLVCEPVVEKVRPKSAFQARFSLQHCLADAIVSGRFDRSSLADAALRDPRIAALAGRVAYEAEPVFSDRRRLGGSVRIQLADGRDVAHRIEHMRGMTQNPMSSADVIRKFEDNARDALRREAVGSTIESILRLEKIENVSAILRPLSDEENLRR
ncbi:MAG: MmgE/PrpD family protein [Parvibaculaceae bacterium]